LAQVVELHRQQVPELVSWLLGGSRKGMRTPPLNVIDDHVYPSGERGRFVREMSDKCPILTVPSRRPQSIPPMN
jgi:hypothetical protein